MELWRKSNRFLKIMIGLERGWCCLGSVCGIIEFDKLEYVEEVNCMGLFDFFKKKVKLTEEQQKWNKMWELWVEEKVDSPYLQLMTYQSEVNNGGHDQYFNNIDNTGNLQEELIVLQTILSKKTCS